MRVGLVAGVVDRVPAPHGQGAYGPVAYEESRIVRVLELSDCAREDGYLDLRSEFC